MKRNIKYFPTYRKVKIPSPYKIFLSRLFFPLLIFLSREHSYKLGLIPIDDERVIMALKNVKGKVLDIGCGSNTFVKSYGNGIGVDVVDWYGCDKIIQDSSSLPFKDQSFNTVSYLASLNHIGNREKSVKEAYRILKPGGKILITMISPNMGKFIHWLRFRNDPDHLIRDIDSKLEVMGMSTNAIFKILKDTGFNNIIKKSFVFGINNLYIAEKQG